MIKISLLAFLILWHKIEKGDHFLAGAILPRFQGSYLPHFNVKIMTYHTCSPLPQNLVISRTNWNLDCTLEICDKYEFTYALSNDAILMLRTRYHYPVIYNLKNQRNTITILTSSFLSGRVSQKAKPVSQKATKFSVGVTENHSLRRRRWKGFGWAGPKSPWPTIRAF